MTDYASEATNAVKKFDKGADFQKKDAKSIAASAQSFIKDTKENASEMADKGAKYLKSEGQKDLQLAKDFVKENPVKSAVYALGIGALLSYFLLPRR